MSYQPGWFFTGHAALSNLDLDLLSAIASTSFGSAESVGKQLERGSMSLNMIEFADGPVMFSPVGENAFVVIVADKTANLGMIRLMLKQDCQKLAKLTTIKETEVNYD